jgi:hypothetical protein
MFRQLVPAARSGGRGRSVTVRGGATPCVTNRSPDVRIIHEAAAPEPYTRTRSERPRGARPSDNQWKGGLVLAEITFLGFIWLIFISYLFIMYIVLLFNVAADLFSDKETSGVKKALWILFLFALPLLAMLVYLIVRGQGMAQRTIAKQQQAKDAADDYIRSVAGGPAAEIEKAKGLLDSGAITQAEFDSLKAKLLA